MNAPTEPLGRRHPLPVALLGALRERFGERCSTARAVCEQHGRDESPFDPVPPDAVVYCESTEDVADAVALARTHGMPVIPFGAGSSLEGHLLAVQGGISLDLTRAGEASRNATRAGRLRAPPKTGEPSLNSVSRSQLRRR